MKYIDYIIKLYFTIDGKANGFLIFLQETLRADINSYPAPAPCRSGCRGEASLPVGGYRREAKLLHGKIENFAA